MLPTNTIIDNCSVAQLKELIALGASDNFSKPIWQEVDTRAHIIRLLDELRIGVKPTGKELLQAICSPGMTISLLEQYKELAKGLMPRTKTGGQKAAVNLLYHLVVAAALVYNNINISSISSNARLALYDDLALAFRGDPIGRVFQTAVEKILDKSMNK